MQNQVTDERAAAAGWFTRRRLAGAAARAGVLALAACGTRREDAVGGVPLPKARRTGVALTVVALPLGAGLEDFNRVLDGFAKANPGWTAQFGEADDAKVLAMIAGGTPPDVTRIKTSQLAALSRTKELVQLDPLIQRDRYDLKDFFTQGIKQWQWDGKQHGLPRGFANHVLFYNVDLFERAGRKPPPTTWTGGAWTWDEFLADARALTATTEDGKGGYFGYGLWPGLRSAYGLYVWNAGGDILSADGKMCVLDRPEAIEGLQFMGDLITRHRVAPTMAVARAERTGAMWTAGRVAMHAITNANASAYRRSAAGFRWDVAVMPKGKGTRQTTGGGAGWGIPTASPNREEAWGLLQHLLNPDSQKLQANSFYPSRRSIAQWLVEAEPDQAPKNRRVLLEAADHSRPDPVHAQWDAIEVVIDKELDPLFAGAASAREVAAKIKQQVDPLLTR